MWYNEKKINDKLVFAKENITMKKVKIILYVITCIAFYFGAVCFFVDGNNVAGIIGTVAGTLFFLSGLLILRKK